MTEVIAALNLTDSVTAFEYADELDNDTVARAAYAVTAARSLRFGVEIVELVLPSRTMAGRVRHGDERLATPQMPSRTVDLVD